MVSLPQEFVATKYPGYFWNTKTRQLFTAKLGILRPLQKRLPSVYNEYRTGWQVSVNGRRRFMEYSALCALKPRNSVFPVKFTTVKGDTNNDVPVQLSLLPAGTVVDVYIRG